MSSSQRALPASDPLLALRFPVFVVPPPLYCLLRLLQLLRYPTATLYLPRSCSVRHPLSCSEPLVPAYAILFRPPVQLASAPSSCELRCTTLHHATAARHSIILVFRYLSLPLSRPELPISASASLSDSPTPRPYTCKVSPFAHCPISPDQLSHDWQHVPRNLSAKLASSFLR